MQQTDEAFSLVFDPALEEGKLRAALVWATGLPGCPASAAPLPWLAELLGRVRASGEAFLDPARKAAVRGMLRHGKYKPAGRSKPSSEYLLTAALEGEDPWGGFPLVNGPVDANNAVSLAWGYPASIFDAAKSGRELQLSRGRAEEGYVFNPSGQEIDLEDLILIRRKTDSGAWEACGNPVKDAMATKVFADCRDVVAVVYAPAADLPSELEACARRFSALLGEELGARNAGWRLVDK
jgi:DNA/RNA-binding domain of Phe-tRNA-synthetase-like protein